MRISDWSSDVCSSDLLVHAMRRDRRIRLRIGRLMHHQHPVEQRSGMAAARVEEAGEQRIQITRVAKLAHDPAQLGLEPDGATVRQRGLEQRQRGPQLPYGNPALVQWLR